MGDLRLSELSESQLAELEKRPIDPDYKSLTEILKYVELSRENQLRMCFMKPVFAMKDPESLPQ